MKFFTIEFDVFQFIVVVISFDVQIVPFWGYCEPLYVDFYVLLILAPFVFDSFLLSGTAKWSNLWCILILDME